MCDGLKIGNVVETIVELMEGTCDGLADVVGMTEEDLIGSIVGNMEDSNVGDMGDGSIVYDIVDGGPIGDAEGLNVGPPKY